MPGYPTLWVYTSDDSFDLESSEIDLAIVYGDGNWPGIEATRLFPDYLSPLCAPGMLTPEQAITTPADLAFYPLLHDERKDDWQSWLHLAGAAELDFITGMNFSDPALALDAATLGHGIVLGSLSMARDLIEDGSLVRLFDLILETQEAFYLLQHPRFAKRPSAEKLHSWILKSTTTPGI
ncbi:LysR substrate-binding domain-containing protein [Kiloniella laminariae]|uniref:LysR substrate-binding domain-containing protein n=1 Tax=Kiloniella laminariae TaxID=454162 RepID=A0ABT4LDR2_9PROT|nr:LysR substrate-binding domain-containing protein [Kiloniella laminariae]MCZ4279235.1 LysR substrate-binding domain-containing protein [Kiloniella laminariae]